MKTIKITPPEGFKLGKYNEETGEVEIVPIEVKPKYPLSVKEIKDRYWYIDVSGKIRRTVETDDQNNLSYQTRAEAFLALMQLVELRDSWNEIDGFVANWNNSSQIKHSIIQEKNKIILENRSITNTLLYFGSIATRDFFHENFIDLIETAKELI